MRRFWAATLLLAGLGGGLLQLLGPVQRSRVVIAPMAPADRPVASLSQPAVKAPNPPSRPGRTTSGPVADPDPAMLERYQNGSNLMLPRVAGDGRTPMSVYAAGFDPTDRRPRVGILIAGIGMSEADSLAAIRTLPRGVTLAVSPYAEDVGALLAAARSTGHEYLLAVPMESQEYPMHDPDDRQALMTSLSPAENLDRLLRTMSRLTGYVGVTNALGQMSGERLAGVADQLDLVLEEVAHRGLLFLDARTSQPPLPHAWNRSVDLALDKDPTDATTLDQQLDALTHLALDKGSALGFVSVPRPVTLDRVAAWTNTLASKGVVLAPVSALVFPPSTSAAAR